jgi:hypothetical protein
VALQGLASVALTDGQIARCREVATEARELAREAANDELLAISERLLSLAARLAAELPVAEQHARAGLEAALRTGLAPLVAQLRAELGRALLERGDTAGAEAAFTEAARSEPDPSETTRGLAQISLGWVRLVAGEPRAAIALAEGVLQRLGASPGPGATEAWALLAEAAAASGEVALARRAVASLGERGATRSPARDLGAQLALARALAATGQRQEAIAQLRSIRGDRRLEELALARLEAELRLAELEEDPAALAAARARLETARVGRLLGTRL